MNTYARCSEHPFCSQSWDWLLFVPLGWGPVLGIAATSPERIVQGQPYQPSEKRSFRAARMRESSTRLRRRRSNLCGRIF